MDVGTDTPEAGQDLRGALVEAFAKQREAEAEPKVEIKPEPKAEPEVKAEDKKTDDRARDEAGRFVKQEAAELKTAEVADPTKAVAVKTEPARAPAPPNSWSAEAKAKWHELPAEVLTAIAAREQDFGKTAGKMDEERALGRDITKIFQPYMPILQAEQTTPLQAVQSLLNTAYILRQGQPYQKRAALLDVAKQYGIDLSDAGKPNPSANPELDALRREVAQLKGDVSTRDTQARSAAQAQIQQEIDAFAADPVNAHYEEVKADMAALLSAGRARDLKTAYDMACWARPEVRSSILAQQRLDDEQKRVAEEKQRADEARRKGISITGAPGSTAGARAGSERSLREELEANMAAARGAV